LEDAGIDFGDTVTLRIRGLPQRVKLVRSYGYAREGELICLIGSAGYVEIAINQGDASTALGIRGSEEVEIEG
jgi:hypothetical protein